MSAEDLLDERAGLSGLTYVEVGGTAKVPDPLSAAGDRPAGRGNLHAEGGAKFGTGQTHSLTIDIK